MIEIKLSYDPDPELALENTRFWAPLALTAEQKHGLARPDRDGAGRATSCPSNRSLGGGSSPPTPTRRSPRSSPTSMPGLNHLVFHGPGADQIRFLDQFCEDVVPKLRALT